MNGFSAEPGERIAAVMSMAPSLVSSKYPAEPTCASTSPVLLLTIERGHRNLFAEGLRITAGDLLGGLLQPDIDGGLDRGLVGGRRDHPAGKMGGKRGKLAPATGGCLRHRGVGVRLSDDMRGGRSQNNPVPRFHERAISPVKSSLILSFVPAADASSVSLSLWGERQSEGVLASSMPRSSLRISGD